MLFCLECMKKITATEKDFDTVLKMTLRDSRVLTQRFKRGIGCKSKVTNISKCL